MDVKIAVESAVSTSSRARQVSSMFDAPPAKKSRLEWDLSLDLESQPWNVGLVVGPSGSGKTTVMRHVWGEPEPLHWGAAGVVDDFDASLSVEQVAAVCQAVGFNTIPAWLRPFAVLSNGEKFRVELARRMLETPGVVVVDEFSSVIDRQVAKIASHAVQKFVRKNDRQFVAVGCHYDVIDWLQPDWVLDMATKQFSRRLLQRRPAIECTIGRVPRSAWPMFAPYHYMSARLHRAAKCFGLWVDGRLACFCATLPIAVSTGKCAGTAIYRVSRVVTLPDWQGMGLAMVLTEAIGAEYALAGSRFRNYPAHPAYVRALNRSPNWTLCRAPGNHSSVNTAGNMGGRPCAVFEYVGPVATSPRLGL